MTRYRERLEAGEFEPPASGSSPAAMTKAQLHAEANRLGVTVDQSATKDELRAAVEAARS